MTDGYQYQKAVSLFGGIGGFDLALQRRGIDVVYYNDFDKYAVQTYNKNNGTRYESRDIKRIASGQVPDHDILCAGFPCQSFSTAGKRGGFDDTRGTLFFEIIRIARDKRPSLLLLENVKGLLNHRKGETFGTMLTALWELGYDAEWQVLNSKDFGVPQNRERVYIIGYPREKSRPKIFPFGDTAETGHEQEQELPEQVSNTLRTNYGGGYSNETYVLETGKKVSCSSVLTPNRVTKKQNGRNIKGEGEPSFTLTSGDVHGVLVRDEKVIHNIVTEAVGNRTGSSSKYRDSVEKIHQSTGYIRRLTPVECERLQGFPDGWTEGVSETQRYKQLGNAVTVNVVETILRRLRENC